MLTLRDYQESRKEDMDGDVSNREYLALEKLDEGLLISERYQEDTRAVKEALKILADAYADGFPLTASIAEEMRDRGILPPISDSAA